MDLGQTLRQARLDAGLSQRELCGDKISRNMLSQIENGTAHPSMDTLSYLAEKLGKPVGYFLDEPTPTSPNHALIEQARATFAAGNYGQTLSMLKQYELDDPVFDWEYYLLEAQSCMELATKAIQAGHTAHAMQLLDRAALAGEQTPYYNDATRRQRLLLLCRVTKETIPLPSDDDALLVRASIAIGEGDAARALQYLDAAENKTSVEWAYHRGRAYLNLEKYADALPYLKTAEEYRPKECIAMLEQCYRELGDFKGAYFYSCKRKTMEDA